MNLFLNKKLSPLILVSGLLILFAFGCKKDEEEETSVMHETGTMTDIDGNVYKTIKIGNQWWMAENLKVTKYRDSFLVRNASSNVQWAQDTAGAYTPYGEYSNTDNVKVYGYLYNWHSVHNEHQIAPAGWHIPTDAEWKTLEQYLGMSASETDMSGWRGSHEGEKLKKEAPNGWDSYENVWSTNESGFTALAGSCRLFDGREGLPGLSSTGFWWTASEQNNTDAWYRYLDYKNPNVFRSEGSKNYGFSIRCVKD